MHARMNTLIGDPARIDDLTHYLETTVRPHVEAQPGCRGMAVLVEKELGVTIVGSYWDTAEAMAASEQTVQTSRKEATELANGVVTVEHYEVPVFLRRSRPGAGAGVRITTVEGDPAQMDITIQAFRDTALPALQTMPGVCSSQLLVDPTTGRSLTITAYDDAEALAASRAGISRVRTDTLAKTHATVRSVQEFSLLSTSVREGSTTALIQREAELWNTRDRVAWQALLEVDAFEARAPGGMRLTGPAAVDALWSTWQDAFPDNHLIIVGAYEDERGGVMEGRFTGTHTGTLRGPAGEIPATGRSVDVPFCNVHRFEAGKMVHSHLYFDQMELLTQLGLLAGTG